MSCLKFGKQFMPTAKVWKKFTSALQKKLHKLKKSKAIRKTRKSINKTFCSIVRGNQSKSSGLRIKRRINHHQQQYQHNYPPVFIDELFREQLTFQPKVPRSIVPNKMGETIEKSSFVGGSRSTVTKPTAAATASTVSNVTKVEIKLFDRLVVVETCNEDEKGTTSSANSIVSPVPSQLHSIYGAHALKNPDKEKVSTSVSPLHKLPRGDAFTHSSKEKKASTSVSAAHHLHKVDALTNSTKEKVPNPVSLLHHLREVEALSTSTKQKISPLPPLRGADALTISSTEKKRVPFAVSPLHHRGVDERAEEFIAKFKQEMRLQR